MLARLVLCLLLVCATPAMAQLPKLEVSVKRVDVGEMHVFEVVSSGK